ncbi:MAG: TetR/AcrR family transcriptional regulator [Bdellovibrionales bacterium]|jgi:AcrR family transcriptional regulator|nr:TetR/AcrR family transcriptional regulator [Bdellovibrionales bacterium]MBL7670580.1 TetR/AcrR family transcriptional regulator [Pseudobdellovibrionaceae bacterium]
MNGMNGRNLNPESLQSLEMARKKTKKQKVKLQVRPPTQERSRQTVSTILDACAKILVQEGYFGVTTDKIAKDAGVSIGSIYQFFGNKESVISAVIVDLFERDKLFFEKAMSNIQDLSPEQRINKLIATALDLYNTEIELRSRIQNIYQYLVDQKYYSKLMESYISLFVQFIPKTEGRNNQTQAMLTVHSFIGLMEHIVQTRKDFSSDKALTTEITRFFCGYLNNKW